MKTLLKSTLPVERSKTRVLYYYKPIDGEIVARVISSLNFGFETRPSELEAYETLLLWFGDGVPLDHVKLLALTLVHSNIRLRFIRPYKFEGKIFQV